MISLENKELQNIKDFLPYLAFLDYKKGIKNVVKSISDQNIQKEVKEKLAQFNVKKPKIVVIGEQSSGKSTLMNVLLQKNIFPRKKELCTKCPVNLVIEEVDDDENEKAIISFMNAEKVQGSLKDLYETIEEKVFGFLKNNVSEETIKITYFKKTMNFIPLNFIDLPGYHVDHKITKKIIEDSLLEGNYTYIFVNPWGEGSDTSPIIMYLKEYFFEKNKKNENGLKKKFIENSAMVYTKCDLQKYKFRVPQFDFVKQENMFFTAFGGQHTDDIYTLLDNENEYFSSVGSEKYPKEKCGTQTILKFIGNEYSRHVKNLSQDLYNLLVKSKNEVAKILKREWKFWDSSKEHGFKLFKNALVESMKNDSYKSEKIHSTNLSNGDCSQLLLGFKSLLKELSCNWDPTWQRFNFFFPIIENLIVKVLDDYQSKLKEKHLNLLFELKTINDMNYSKTFSLTTNEWSLFAKKEFLLCWNKLFDEILNFETENIEENNNFLSLFNTYQSFRAIDLSQKRGVQLFTDQQIKDFKL